MNRRNATTTGSIDVRYLVRLGDDDNWTYSICVIEGYSRKILAGMVSEHQDSLAILQLRAPAEYGKPDGIVSDNGSVFTSEAYQGLLHGLGIEVCYIEKGKALGKPHRSPVQGAVAPS